MAAVTLPDFVKVLGVNSIFGDLWFFCIGLCAFFILLLHFKTHFHDSFALGDKEKG